jgi:hypothetical protein
MKVLVSIIAPFILINATGQNLVPNHSFEIWEDDCPWSAGGLEVNGSDIVFLADWYSMNWTPDYMHGCSDNSSNGVPQNAWGYQYAADGEAYVALAAYAPFPTKTEESEYIAVQLSEPMVIGTNYFVSIFLSDADGGNLEYAECSSNNMGIRFTKDPIYYWHQDDEDYSLQPQNFAHLYMEDILIDSIGWFHLQGYFEADSAYTHIVVGNHFERENTDVIQPFDQCISVIYVDNVCVSTDSANCDLRVNVPTFYKHLDIAIYPNPTNQFITIELEGKQSIKSKLVMNNLGQLVINDKSNSTQIDLGDLPNGIYLVHVETIEGNVFKTKVVLVN